MSIEVVGEVLYSTPYEPSFANALDVLAFLLVSPRVFGCGCAPPHPACEIRELLTAAKADAVERWLESRRWWS